MPDDPTKPELPPVGDETPLMGRDEIAALASSLAGRRVLLVGAGDLARKKLHWVMLLKRLGLDVYLADKASKPTALDTLGPYLKEFISLESSVAEQHLVDIGHKESFYIVDISTWADSHLALALRFQDCADWLVDTKPVDTHLDFLRTIHRYSLHNDPFFRHLIARFLVHDHYGGRWVVRAAEDLMPRWHAEHGFITEAQIYILEHKTVNQESQRLGAIKEGMCLDLMPHAFRVLESLMPNGLVWEVGGLRYARCKLTLDLSGGAREHNVGCRIPGFVETFAAVSFQGKDIVEINGQNDQPEAFPFRCLVVVGKGIAANEGDDRDTKGVVLTFQSGHRLVLDLESQRISAPDGDMIAPPSGVLHRGINWPLIELTKTGTSRPLHRYTRGFFQSLDAAYQGMELIAAARGLRWLGSAYHQGYSCADLVNKIPRDWWGPVSWQLRNVPQIHIGHVNASTTLIP